MHDRHGGRQSPEETQGCDAPESVGETEQPDQDGRSIHPIGVIQHLTVRRITKMPSAPDHEEPGLIGPRRQTEQR